ncbi:MAG: VOC family protein [Candidatus Pacebacteria bacterium]|nr:VOC family protein [Candidatus Paceibacterota bacterium]
MRINHITILVSNRLKSAKFYSEILGLEIAEKGKSRWIKIGDQYLHLAQDSGKPIKGSFYHFCIEVKNVIDFVKKLISKGVDVFDLNDELNKVNVNQNLDRKHRQFFINDPDGNMIELCDKNNEYFK